MTYFRDFLWMLGDLIRGNQENKKAVIQSLAKAIDETQFLKSKNRPNPYDVPNEDCKKVKKAWSEVIINLQMINESEEIISQMKDKHKFWSDRELRQSVGSDQTLLPMTLKQIDDVLFDLKKKYTN